MKMCLDLRFYAHLLTFAIDVSVASQDGTCLYSSVNPFSGDFRVATDTGGRFYFLEPGSSDNWKMTLTEFDLKDFFFFFFYLT